MPPCNDNEMTSGTIRAFIAVEISDELKEKLREIQTLIAGRMRGLNLPEKDSIHLTVKFLGNVDESAAPGIARALETACAAVRPFTLVAEGVGGFPSLRSPRVAWVGIKDEGALARLHADIEDRLVGLGIDRETVRYRPHITLCRARSIDESQDLSRAVNELQPVLRVEFPVTELVFFKSVLTPKGPVHTPIARVGFGG